MIASYNSNDIVFIADTHFDHANIIRYCDRPFKSTNEMNECMLQTLIDADTANKIIFHLGDYSFNFKYAAKWKPKGKHILIMGNHDRNAHIEQYKTQFNTVIGRSNTWRMNKLYIRVDGIVLLLTHTPTSIDNDIGGAVYNLHGHHHNNVIRARTTQSDAEVITQYGLPTSYFDGRYINVGVELTGYRCVSLSEIIPEKFCDSRV